MEFTDPDGQVEKTSRTLRYNATQRLQQQSEESLTFSVQISNFMVETTQDGQTGSVTITAPYTVSITVFKSGRVQVDGDRHGLFADMGGDVFAPSPIARGRTVDKGGTWEERILST